MSLRETRRRRLLAAMQEAGIADIVLYGNAWQGDYLRYALRLRHPRRSWHCDCVCRRHGRALSRQRHRGRARRGEAPDVQVASRARHRARGRRAVWRPCGQPSRCSRHRAASCPTLLVERAAASRSRTAPRWSTGCSCTSCRPRSRRIRRAAHMADDAYAAFRAGGAAGRAAIRDGGGDRGLSAQPRLPGQFHDHRLGRQGRARHDAAVGAPHRGRRSGDHGAHACARRLFRADLPHARGRQGKRGAAARFRVFREALEAGVAAVRPGATAADVARAENDVFRKYGLGDTPPANGRACAATALACSAIPSRIFSRTWIRRSCPAWR